ncbi:unnamed protein product [Jaminaea pallidilutea]
MGTESHQSTSGGAKPAQRPSVDSSMAPLHVAAAEGNASALREALSAGLGYHIDADVNGVAPLHAAASTGSEPCVKLLLEHGAAANVVVVATTHEQSDLLPGAVGSTPLHFAAANGHSSVARILLTHGAKPAVRDAAGLTPQALAEANGHRDCIHLLRMWIHSYGSDGLAHVMPGTSSRGAKQGGELASMDSPSLPSSPMLSSQKSFDSLASAFKGNLLKQKASSGGAAVAEKTGPSSSSSRRRPIPPVLLLASHSASNAKSPTVAARPLRRASSPGVTPRGSMDGASNENDVDGARESAARPISPKRRPSLPFFLEKAARPAANLRAAIANSANGKSSESNNASTNDLRVPPSPAFSEMSDRGGGGASGNITGDSGTSRNLIPLASSGGLSGKRSISSFFLRRGNFDRRPSATSTTSASVEPGTPGIPEQAAGPLQFLDNSLGRYGVPAPSNTQSSKPKRRLNSFGLAGRESSRPDVTRSRSQSTALVADDSDSLHTAASSGLNSPTFRRRLLSDDSVYRKEPLFRAPFPAAANASREEVRRTSQLAGPGSSAASINDETQEYLGELPPAAGGSEGEPEDGQDDFLPASLRESRAAAAGVGDSSSSPHLNPRTKTYLPRVHSSGALSATSSPVQRGVKGGSNRRRSSGYTGGQYLGSSSNQGSLEQLNRVPTNEEQASGAASPHRQRSTSSLSSAASSFRSAPAIPTSSSPSTKLAILPQTTPPPPPSTSLSPPRPQYTQRDRSDSLASRRSTAASSERSLRAAIAAASSSDQAKAVLLANAEQFAAGAGIKGEEGVTITLAAQLAAYGDALDREQRRVRAGSLSSNASMGGSGGGTGSAVPSSPSGSASAAPGLKGLTYRRSKETLASLPSVREYRGGNGGAGTTAAAPGGANVASRRAVPPMSREAHASPRSVTLSTSSQSSAANQPTSQFAGWGTTRSASSPGQDSLGLLRPRVDGRQSFDSAQPNRGISSPNFPSSASPSPSTLSVKHGKTVPVAASSGNSSVQATRVDTGSGQTADGEANNQARRVRVKAQPTTSTKDAATGPTTTTTTDRTPSPHTTGRGRSLSDLGSFSHASSSAATTLMGSNATPVTSPESPKLGSSDHHHRKRDGARDAKVSDGGGDDKSSSTKRPQPQLTPRSITDQPSSEEQLLSREKNQEDVGSFGHSEGGEEGGRESSKNVDMDGEADGGPGSGSSLSAKVSDKGRKVKKLLLGRKG